MKYRGYTILALVRRPQQWDVQKKDGKLYFTKLVNENELSEDDIDEFIIIDQDGVDLNALNTYLEASSLEQAKEVIDGMNDE